MGKNGLNPEDLLQRELLFAKRVSSFESLISAETRTDYDKAFRAMSELLFEAARDGEPLHTLKLERQCISLEQVLKGKESPLLDKQISRSGEAELSLKLVQDPEAYRKHINALYPNGVRTIQKGEGMHTFVNSQVSYLGIGKRYFFAMEEARAEFYSARQANLQAGLASFQNRQREALFS